MELLTILVWIYLCGGNKIVSVCFLLVIIIIASIIITFLLENKILLCTGSVLTILFIIFMFLNNYKEIRKINTPKERKKQEQLSKIREWSRRNRC